MDNGYRRNRQELLSGMTNEFRYLRNIIREVGEAFVIRRESQVEALVDVLGTLSTDDLRSLAPKWLHQLRQLKVKPTKGRLKDLKQIDLIMEEFSNMIAELQAAVQVKPKKPAKLSAPASCRKSVIETKDATL